MKNRRPFGEPAAARERKPPHLQLYLLGMTGVIALIILILSNAGRITISSVTPPSPPPVASPSAGAASAGSIRNDGCPVDLIKPFVDMNEHLEKGISEGAKVSRITAIICMTHPEYAPSIWRVYLRAYDGRELQWKPSDGTDDLKRMMIFGR